MGKKNHWPLLSGSDRTFRIKSKRKIGERKIRNGLWKSGERDKQTVKYLFGCCEQYDQFIRSSWLKIGAQMRYTSLKRSELHTHKKLWCQTEQMFSYKEPMSNSTWKNRCICCDIGSHIFWKNVMWKCRVVSTYDVLL